MKPIKWVFYPENLELISHLSKNLGVSEVVSRFLINRKIDNVQDAKTFLRPELNDLHDPFLLSGMKEATERIHTAINRREKILIYGDFDADGITSTSLLLHFFKLMNSSVTHYIPNRINEGYSFTPKGLKHIIDNDVNLVISVDSGISSYDEIGYLKDNGVDVIITDHHEPPEILPPAVAIIDPKCKTCGYPFKQLSGVGVAYKLAWGVAQHFSPGKKVSPEFRQFLLNALAWVALGTVTDLVPLVGENRILAKFGLPAIQNSTNPGMRALCDLISPSKRLASEDISYRIGPRINASGRMGCVELAVDLFLTTSYKDAQDLAAKLDDKNKERQEIEKKIYDEISEQISEMKSDILIASNDSWHPGVIGVVASKLVEQYAKPVILITFANKKGRGSCRSIPGFDVFKALTHCSDLLDAYGGHSSAGGLQIDKSSVEPFKTRIAEFLKETMPGATFTSELNIDCELHLSSLSKLLLSEIEKLAPFGEANPEPVFASTGLQLVRPAQQVGRFSNHLSFIVRQGKTPISFKTIAFGRGDQADRLNNASSFSLAYTPKMNFFNGRSNIELEVRDIQIDD